jgi:hypothetical protein
MQRVSYPAQTRNRQLLRVLLLRQHAVSAGSAATTAIKLKLLLKQNGTVFLDATSITLIGLFMEQVWA